MRPICAAPCEHFVAAHREVSQAYGYGYDNRICSRQPRVGFCFANYRYMFHLSALAFIMSVFLTNMTDRDPVFYHGFIHCIFSSFCLQMTNNFLSIASTIQVKIIPWEMFLIWDKNTANVSKTVSVFLRRV